MAQPPEPAPEKSVPTRLHCAERVAHLDISLIRQIAEAAPPGAISLGVGEPTWDLPDPGRRVLNEWSGRAPYGQGTGLPDLRRAVASFYGVDYDETFITVGSVGALFSLLQAWIGNGDKVLVPDPGFVTYRNIILYSGAIPVSYALNQSNKLRFDPALATSLLDDPAVKAIILNHPSNPTGGGISVEAMVTIVRACEDRGILLISDEVYRDLYLGDRPVGLRDVTRYGIVTSSVSKAWGAPGLRVGWATGDPAILAPARTVHSYATTSPAVVSQKAACALIEASESIHPAARQELRSRWDAFAAAVSENFGFAPEQPDGAFYYFMPLPESVHEDPIRFAITLRDEAKVIAIPGLVFGEQGRGFLRISYAARPDEISEAIRRIAPFWTQKSFR